MLKNQIRKKWTAGVLAVAMTVTLVPVYGCPETAEAKSVPKLNAKRVILTVGKKVALKVKKAPSGAKITWKSKNKKIAAISKKGLVSAKKKGKTSIVCTVKAKVKNSVKKYHLKCNVSVGAKSTVAAAKITTAPSAKEQTAGSNSNETISYVDMGNESDLNGDLQTEPTPVQNTATHAGNTVGLITIPIGQGNFNSNGRYRLRIHSNGYETVMARIHVVEQTAPTLQLKEAGSIYPGQNIHFAVNGAPYAVDDGLERATLKTPSGEIVELKEVDDCYRISQDLFVLYNDPARNDGNGVNFRRKSSKGNQLKWEADGIWYKADFTGYALSFF